jgi:hypothetical protein
MPNPLHPAQSVKVYKGHRAFNFPAHQTPPQRPSRARPLCTLGTACGPPGGTARRVAVVVDHGAYRAGGPRAGAGPAHQIAVYSRASPPS